MGRYDGKDDFRKGNNRLRRFFRFIDFVRVFEFRFFNAFFLLFGKAILFREKDSLVVVLICLVFFLVVVLGISGCLVFCSIF